MPWAAIAGLAACHSPAGAPADVPPLRSAPPVVQARAYAAHFATEEDTLSQHGAWRNGRVLGLDWNDVRVTGDHAFGAALTHGYNDCIAVLDAAMGPDQFAQATVHRRPGYSPRSSHEVELLLRFRIEPHRARGYEVLWGHSGEINVVRWNGPLGDYTPLGPSRGPNIGPAADGDVLRAEIRGATIKVWRNGALVMTALADGTWRDGQPGMGFWPTGDAEPAAYGWRSFEAGSL